MLSILAISNYRSLRELVIPLQRLNLVIGPNGSGKSSLYRALRLIAEIAQGRVIPSLAREGGFQSTLWAGPEELSRSVLRGDHPVQGTRRKRPVNLRLGFAGDEFGYTIELGLPPPGPSLFGGDPHIKRECIWNGQRLRPSSLLVDRRGPLVKSRGEDGEWTMVTQNLSPFDSMMMQCADPRNTPEMLMLREHLRGWRFYDQLRTDAGAPARLPQIGTFTPVLSNDGADLAAAIETIRATGGKTELDDCVKDAFPGASVSVISSDGRFEVEMQQQGLLRPLKGAEISDGTLRYLLLVAALLTPRPPELLVLNEPETSIHPDLLGALARLVIRAAERSQVFVVSHASGLIEALQNQPRSQVLSDSMCHTIRLEKHFSETRAAGTDQLTQPAWQWPAR